MRLILPYPPSDNTYYAVVRGRKVISKKGREFKNDVFKKCQGMASFNKKRIEINVVTHPKDRRIRDINNIWKSLCDSLTFAGIWDDDEQIDKAFIKRGEIDEDKIGYIVVDIYESI